MGNNPVGFKLQVSDPYDMYNRNMNIKGVEKMSLPDQLAQQQLDAYNAKDINQFVEVYHKEVTVRDFPSNEVVYSGIVPFKERYAKLFKDNPNLNAALVKRIVMGNKVIDHEYITGKEGMEPSEAIAIYEIEENKIKNIWFIRK
jgi:hypothetical protein